MKSGFFLGGKRDFDLLGLEPFFLSSSCLRAKFVLCCFYLVFKRGLRFISSFLSFYKVS